MRLLADGILVPWANVAIWLLLPVPGTILGMCLWYLARYFLDRAQPWQRRLREACAEKDATINALKARILDEVDARRAAENKRNELHVTRRVV